MNKFKFDEANYPKREKQFIVFRRKKPTSEWRICSYMPYKSLQYVKQYVRGMEECFPGDNFAIVEEVITRSIRG